MHHSERRIEILDDLVSMVDRNFIYQFVTRSRFSLGWADSADMSKNKYKSIHSFFSLEDVENSRMGAYLTHPAVAVHLEGYEWSHSVANLSTPSDVNFTHTHHPKERVVLYYVNLEWKSEWYGETMFFNDADTAIFMAARYTPGRIIVFDGAIPHSIRPQSVAGPQYRFTLANVFRLKAQEA